MMLNILTDSLPDKVMVNSTGYTVYTDFRYWISFYEIIEDKKYSDLEKISAAYEMFRNDKPQDITAAYSAVCGFAKCSDIPRAGKLSKTASSDAKAPCLSWKYDAPYVVSAFRQIYGINLLTAEMHWYEFFSLFMGLPDDTPIKQRMALRQLRTGDIKDKEYRKQMRKAQRAVAIPCPVLTAEQIGNAFM